MVHALSLFALPKTKANINYVIWCVMHCTLCGTCFLAASVQTLWVSINKTSNYCPLPFEFLCALSDMICHYYVHKTNQLSNRLYCVEHVIFVWSGMMLKRDQFFSFNLSKKVNEIRTQCLWATPVILQRLQFIITSTHTTSANETNIPINKFQACIQWITH